MSIPRLSQETLAEMVGTTRSRVSFFMNRFRKLGFIKYDSQNLHVHSSLLKIVLHDESEPAANRGGDSNGHERKTPEAPARPGGGPPDRDRAQRPPLRSPRRAVAAL